MQLRVSFVLACLGALAGIPASAQQAASSIAALAQSRDADSLRLRRLIALHWDYTMREYPEFATAVGYPGQNARWTDNSADALARRKRELNEPLAVLQSIDRAKLPAPDQLNYDLFRRNITDAIEEGRFPGELMAMTQLGGVQQDVPSTIAQSPANTVRDYEDIVARLRGVPALVDQTIALLERGLAAHVTPPRVTLRDVPQQVQNLIVDDPLTSPLLQAFTKVSAAVPSGERERLRVAAVAAYRDAVAPALRTLWGTIIQPDEIALLPAGLRDRVVTLTTFSTPVTAGPPQPWTRWDAHKHLLAIVGAETTRLSAMAQPRLSATAAAQLLANAVALHADIRAAGAVLADGTSLYQDNWRGAMEDTLRDLEQKYAYLELLA